MKEGHSDVGGTCNHFTRCANCSNEYVCKDPDSHNAIRDCRCPKCGSEEGYTPRLT